MAIPTLFFLTLVVAAFASQSGANRIEAPLADAAFQGARVQLHFQAPPDGQILVETPSLPAAAGPGTSLKMSWAIDDTLVYPAPAETAAGGAPSRVGRKADPTPA